jgi:membrane-associated phospholipid phosphatase
VKGYSFVDYATQGYVAIVGALILLFHETTVVRWQWLVGAHLAVLGIIQAMIWWNGRCPAAKALDFFRHFYPVLLYAGLFAETGWLNQMFMRGYLDPVVIRWDQSLFGCQPSLLLMEKLPFLLVSEVFYAAYFSYYIMIGGVGLALYLRNRRAFFHYVSVVSFVFYVCYLIYIVVPVIGPPVFFHPILGYSLPAQLQQLAPPEEYPQAVRSGVFFQIMMWIYEVFEAPGAAIPSSHVAVALCTVFFSFRYLRPIRWPHLAVAVLLCLATIYCRYHYASDVLAGIATAALLIPAANWLYARFNGKANQLPS